MWSIILIALPPALRASSFAASTTTSYPQFVVKPVSPILTVPKSSDLPGTGSFSPSTFTSSL
jgi:hypothetical protein